MFFPVKSFPSGIVVTWNPSDKVGGITLSNGNLDASESQTVPQSGVRATLSRLAGKYYWETNILLDGGGNGQDIYCSIVTASTVLSSGSSASVPLWWRGRIGTYSINGAAAFSASMIYVQGDVLSFAVDFDNKNFWVRINGGSWVGGGDPATLTTPTGTYTDTVAVFPAYMTDDQTSTECKVRLQPNSASFSYSLPSGFDPYGA